MSFLPWPAAWQQALYGRAGFYRGVGPAGHFATATHPPTGVVLARGLLTLAEREGAQAIVDIGAGRGELLTAVRSLDPGMPLTGLDVVDRPSGLHGSIAWLRSPGGAELPDELDGLSEALVIAHEWLDVVPCAIAEADADGSGSLRQVLVDPSSGQEQLGDPLVGPELSWALRHWPALAPGERVEIGLARDLAWSSLLARISSGCALAVDYGHIAADRPVGGTLTGFADGGQVAPVPDGTCDLTAHVAMDSLVHDELTTQRDALRSLGLRRATPPLAQASSDPPAYLRALAEASHAATLMDPAGFGGFLWALRRVPQAGRDTADSGS